MTDLFDKEEPPSSSNFFSDCNFQIDWGFHFHDRPRSLVKCGDVATPFNISKASALYHGKEVDIVLGLPESSKNEIVKIKVIYPWGIKIFRV